MGNFQPFPFPVDFEAPKYVFVVKIGSGVGEKIVDSGRHFSGDLGKQPGATQRKSAVSHPIVYATVIRGSRYAAIESFARRENTVIELVVFGFRNPRGTHIVISFGTPFVQTVGEYPSVGLDDKHIIPLGERLVKEGRHHEPVIGGDTLEIVVGKGYDAVGRIVVHEGPYVERMGLYKAFLMSGEYVETSTQGGVLFGVQLCGVDGYGDNDSVVTHDFEGLMIFMNSWAKEGMENRFSTDFDALIFMAGNASVCRNKIIFRAKSLLSSLLYK